MRNAKRIVWGVILLFLGVLLGLRVFGVEIDLLFEGWWTLFLIVPGFMGIIFERRKMGSIILFLIGIVLFLAAQGVITYDMAWKIGAPIFIVIIAIKMIISGFRRSKSREARLHFENVVIDGDNATTAIFGGREMSFAGQPFNSGNFVAIFGGVDCDLRDAIIEHDCQVKAVAIFGGVDIIVPKGVNVKVESTSIFGGTDDTCERDPAAPVTIYIDTVSIFGGVEIK